MVCKIVQHLKALRVCSLLKQVKALLLNLALLCGDSQLWQCVPGLQEGP